MPSDPSSPDVGPGLTPSELDARRRAARSVDWRFLLSDPVPASAVLVGEMTGPVREGLEAIGVPDIHALAASQRTDDRATWARSLAGDLVVVRPRRERDLARAASLVRPGGMLVAEVAGVGRPFRAGARRWPATLPPVRVARAARAAGFAVESYLRWPDPDRTAAFVSLQGSAGLRAMVARQVPGPIADRGRSMLGAAVRWDVIPAVAPAVTVLARRPSPLGAEDASDGTWLGRMCREAGLSGPILLLTPGYRASAHVVGLVLDQEDPTGGPVGVIKAARTPDAGASVAREGMALQAVADSLGNAGFAPRLLKTDPHVLTPYLIETGVQGTPLDPASVRRDRDGAAASLAAFVRRLPRRETRSDAGSTLVAPALDVIAASAGPAADALVERSRTVVGALDVPLPRVTEHGDLAHPNLVRRADGALGAVDWERAERDGLPLHDLCVGLAYVAAAAAGATTAPAIAVALADALLGSDPWASPLVDAELAHRSVDPGLRNALLVAPWIRVVAWLARRTDPAWIREDRAMAAWHAMLARVEAEGPALRGER